MVETGSVGFIRKEKSQEVIGSRGRSSLFPCIPFSPGWAGATLTVLSLIEQSHYYCESILKSPNFLLSLA